MSKEHDFTEEARIVPRLLVGLVSLVSRFPILVLAIALVAMILSGYVAATRLTFLTQRSDLVSPKKDYQQRWQKYLEEFGDDDDMVVVVQGKNQEQMKKALEEVAQKLQEKPQLFDRIFYKVDLRSLRNRALLYLSTEQIRDIQNNIKSMNLLLETPVLSGFDPLFGWKSLTVNHLLEEAERRTFNYHTMQNVRSADEHFLRQVDAIVTQASATLEDPADYANPWLSVLPPNPRQKDLMAEPQYFRSGDGSLFFLLVRPIKNMSSFTLAEENIEEIRKIIDQVRGNYPEVEFGLTGLPVLENDEMVASQADTTTASWLALLGVAGLYWLVYRCVRYPLLTVTTLLVGTIWALGWLTLTVGHLNILSATFAVMLIGLGDYGVLWITQYEQERALGADLKSAMQLTTFKVGPSIMTAAATTALGFFSAMLVDFRAVRELGWIAGSGVLLCAMACFTVLPACVCLLDRKPSMGRAILPFVQQTSWMPWINRKPRWVLLGGGLVFVLFGILATQVKYDHNLLRLQAPSLDSVKWEMTLVEHTAGASWYAISYTSTPEEALALKTRYEQLPTVSQVVEVASLLPRDQDLKLELVKDIHHRLRKLPERKAMIPHMPPNQETTIRMVRRLMDSLPPQSAKVSPVASHLRKTLEHFLHLVQRSDPTLATERLKLFEELLTRDLAEDLHKLRDVSSPGFITVADFPASLRERYLGKTGTWRLCIFGKGSLWEFAPLSKFVSEIQQIDPEATGKPFSTLAGLKAMQNGFKWACIYALVAMIAVLLMDFRNPWHMTLAILPLFFGIVTTFGIMGLFGVPLNPANMIALPLILGVGADNGVHIVHDYLSKRGKGRYALGRCTGQGIFVAALTTIFGFGTLMIAQHRGLAGLGLLLTIGISCCLVTALVFLPALLKILDERQQKQKDKPKQESSLSKAA